MGLKDLHGEEAILSYSLYYLKKIAKGEKVKDNLTIIYQLLLSKNMEELIPQAQLLYWAWGDIDYDDSHINHYLESANASNIESIVIQFAKDWLEENE